MVFIVWPFNNDRPSSSSWNWKHLRKISFHFWWNSFRSLSRSHSFNLLLCVSVRVFSSPTELENGLGSDPCAFSSRVCVFLSLFCEEAKEMWRTECGCWWDGHACKRTTKQWQPKRNDQCWRNPFRFGFYKFMSGQVKRARIFFVLESEPKPHWTHTERGRERERRERKSSRRRSRKKKQKWH